MIFATMHDAVPLLGIAGLLLAGAGLAVGLAVWIVRTGIRNRRPLTARIVTATVLVVASVPGWGYGGLLALIGIAAAGCPPDAYECPF